MSFDFKSWISKVQKGGKNPRIPKEQPLVLASLDFAKIVVGDQDFSHAKPVADELQSIAEFYYVLSDKQATKPRTRGRQLHMADIGFIFGMARLWAHKIGPVGFRSYRNTRPNSSLRGGQEAANIFQRVCHAWMQFVDPDRPKPLQPAAFKEAGVRYRRLTGAPRKKPVGKRAA